MALARITTAGENQVLCSGIMGGIKSIWARGGGGAKMGALRLKAIMVQGKPAEAPLAKELKAHNKAIGKKITSTSVIKNALKQVGTPFLYKPSRVLGALGTKNNQDHRLARIARRRQFRPLPARHGRLLQVPGAVPQPERHDARGQGRLGFAARWGLKGNASYDKAQADIDHHKQRTYNGIKGDGKFDKYDKGDGPEYVTVGKFGPMIGIAKPEQVLRLNNILNDLGLDSASTGSAIAWAMELWQRGIITQRTPAGSTCPGATTRPSKSCCS
jgi:aldehyde:ferredoxin oxidoreductase